MPFDPEKMIDRNEGAVPDAFNAVTHRIIGAAMEAHSHLGPGVREHMYEQVLLLELEAAGLRVERQVPIHVTYKGVDLGVQVIDLIVEGCVIVECKAVEKVTETDEAQLVGYLRFSGLPLGLLINFRVARLKDGVTRRINYPPTSSSTVISTRSRSPSITSLIPSVTSALSL